MKKVLLIAALLIGVNADENVVTIEFSSTSDWEAVVVTSDNGDWCSIDKKVALLFRLRQNQRLLQHPY